ncbi:site-specific integrase [Neoroseomonas oryzicola]|uniref:Site-specific integrase n=1 Tax=Neoroseomonas oryzicola TaxID=535904 RepID=A0ABX1EL98_9PROT|nr:site-specific integrase [Neoroseomonas oryzicola]NKE18237.1 site-specific integrase [Neoroseomonas oryzicola]
MNKMTPPAAMIAANAKPSAASRIAPPLSALAVAGRKATRACKRIGKAGLPAIPGLIDSWDDLTPSRRRDLRTAVTMLGRAAGTDLGAIPFTVDNVRAILSATTPAACGVSDTTFKAYRGWIAYLLKRLGLMEERRRSAADLLPSWEPLIAAMSDDKGWIRLRAFVRYCSAHGIVPAAVSDATVGCYREHLRQRDIRGTAHATIRRVVSAWNKATATVQGWPAHRLSAPLVEPRQYSLPLEALPASLRADIEAFRQRLSGANRKGLFQHDGLRRPLRPRSVQTRMVALRLAIAGLVHSGFPVERITALAVLLERDNLQTLLNWHHQRGGGKVGAQLGIMGATLAILARHHVKLPTDRLGPVLEDLKEVRPPKQRFMTAKNERRLSQFSDPDNLGAFLHLPNTLFSLAERIRDGTPEHPGVEARPPCPREAAWLAAIALAIELEFCCPLRLSNLASLRMGQHLLRLGRDREKVTHLMIAGEETKNSDPIRWPVSAALARALDRYVTGFRPHSGPGSSSDWLFPHRDRADAHRDPGGLAKAIVDAVHRHAGAKVNVHLFRAFCGSLVLEETPEAIGDLQLLLGHRTMEVSMIFYRSRKTDRAAERLAGIIERRRKETRALVLGKQVRSRIRRRKT